MKKILLTLILLTSFSAWAESFKLVCITKIRHYCSDTKDCQSNKDTNPSTYTIAYQGKAQVLITHLIGSEKMSSWTMTNTGDNSLNRRFKYLFTEKGIGGVFILSNDLKKFSFFEESGMSLYNLDPILNSPPAEAFGGQIRTGTCIKNS